MDHGTRFPRTAVILTICLFVSLIPRGAAADAAAPDDESGMRIAFTIHNSKIVLPVCVGDSRELKILLDSGMPFDGLLVYKQSLLEELNMPNLMDVRVGGAGGGSDANAVMADSVIYTAGDAVFNDQRVIVLKNDSLEDFPGDGVIGYSLFGHYAVEIDYDEMSIILHDPESFEAGPEWESVPLTFKNNKMIPWVEGYVNVKGNKEIKLSLYIDSASGETVELLTREGMLFELPDGLEEAYLGRGLSGDIHGQRGMISSVRLGTQAVEGVTAAFVPASIRSKQPGADGVIGNGLLKHFNLIYDYKGEHLYLKRNTKFE